mgnify:CR=1 FL=1
MTGFGVRTASSWMSVRVGHDEPETLSYQITLFGPIGADVRQAVHISDFKPRIQFANVLATRLGEQFQLAMQLWRR